ncbi:hypothetical protein [Cupriavidus necator]
MNIPHDKLLHTLGGTLTFAMIHPLGLPWALGAVMAAGVGKEIYDACTGGDVDPYDVLATWMGGAPGWWCQA